MDKHPDKASDYFRKEIRDEDVKRAAHYTYRDGFRLGLGIFIGFLAGSLALTLAVFLFQKLIGLF